MYESGTGPSASREHIESALADPAFASLRLSGAPVLVIANDPGRVVYANDAALALFGADRAAVGRRLLHGGEPGATRIVALSRSLLPGAAPRLERLRFFFGPLAETVTVLCRRVTTGAGETLFALAALGVRAPAPASTVDQLHAAPATATAADRAPALDRAEAEPDGRSPADHDAAPIVAGAAAALVSAPTLAHEEAPPAAPTHEALSPAPGEIGAHVPAAPPAPRAARFAWRTDGDHIFTSVSPSLGEHVGAANADLVGKSFVDFARDHALDAHCRLIAALAARDTFSGVDVLWPATDGLRAPVTLGAAPAFDADDAFLGFHGYGVIAAQRTPAPTIAPTVAAAAAQPSPEHDAHDGAHALAGTALATAAAAHVAGTMAHGAAGAEREPVGIDAAHAAPASESESDDAAIDPVLWPVEAEPPPLAVEQETEHAAARPSADRDHDHSHALTEVAAIDPVLWPVETEPARAVGQETAQAAAAPSSEHDHDPSHALAAAAPHAPIDADEAKISQADVGHAAALIDAAVAPAAAELPPLAVEREAGANEPRHATGVAETSAPLAAIAEQASAAASTETHRPADEAHDAHRTEAAIDAAVGAVEPDLPPLAIDRESGAAEAPSAPGHPVHADYDRSHALALAAPLAGAAVAAATSHAASSGDAEAKAEGADAHSPPLAADASRDTPSRADDEADDAAADSDAAMNVAGAPHEDAGVAAQGETPAPETPQTASGNIVSLRPQSPHEPAQRDRFHNPAAPTLSPVEKSAFEEIGRALGASKPDTPSSAPPREETLSPAASRRARDLIDLVARFGRSDEPPPPPPVAAPLSVVAADHAEAQPADRLARNAMGILERLPVGIVVSRFNVPIYANRTLLELLDYPDVDAFHAAGGLDRLFHGRAPDSGGAQVETREGELYAVDARVQAIDWDGQPATLVTLRRAQPPADSARAKALELDLRQRDSEARELHAILDTATDGVAVLDAEGRILSLNRAGEALFGYDQNEVAGEPFATLVGKESHDVVATYFDGVKSGGVQSVLNDGREIVGRARQGGAIPVFVTLGRLGSGATPKFCAVLRDLTAWKKAERELGDARREAERASALKSDFLAKISHEIRTPLNAILGFAEVIMDERFGPVGNARYRDYMRDIHKSGEHVLSLVNDLLDLSKIEAGKVDLTFTSVDANSIVSECVSIMQPQANRDRVVMRLSLAPNLPNIVADERSMRQIVLNLLSNAVKFNEPGGQVIVSTALTDAGHAVVRIKDTGVGMTDSELETSLEPFRQVSTSRSKEGTGLGLPLTKALVEANRASFTIKSRKGEGTLVEVTFPPTRVLAE